MHLSEEEEREVTEARTTERLHLRPPQPEDAESYRSLLVHPTISEWLRPPPLDPFEPGDGDLWLKDDRRHWEEFEFGPWVLLEQSSGAYVGRAGLRWTEIDGQPAVEVSGRSRRTATARGSQRRRPWRRSSWPASAASKRSSR